MQLIFFFPAPICLALLLSGMMSTRIRRVIQSVVYLPHFISWVIVVALFQQMLGGSGMVDHMLRDRGLPTHQRDDRAGAVQVADGAAS